MLLGAGSGLVVAGAVLAFWATSPSPPPRAGAPNFASSSSDAPLGPFHWNPGLCNCGYHTED